MRRSCRAFTLIELLVVIAIIATLVAILLPSLAAARRTAQATVCLSNIKQAGMGFFQYAIDNRGCIPGTYWQGPINLDWCGRQNAAYLDNPQLYNHPMEASVLWRYWGTQERILECPAARREANGWFDYTVIIRLAGARTDLPFEMTYLLEPANTSSPRARFQSLPMLVEEDSKYYNASYDDGSFAASDQLTQRHKKAAHLGYLDGTAGRFVSPKGPDPEKAEPQDLEAFDLRLVALRQEFTVSSSNETEFGWANKPD